MLAKYFAVRIRTAKSFSFLPCAEKKRRTNNEFVVWVFFARAPYKRHTTKKF